MDKNETIPVQPRGQAFFWATAMFVLALSWGIASALRLNQTLAREEIALAQISFLDFIWSFFLATVFILLLTFFPKLKRGREWLLRAVFFLAIFWGGLIGLSLWLPTTLVLVILVFLLWLWIKKPWVVVHDLMVILAIAGIGPLVASRLAPEIIVLLLIVLSVYDFIAVYQTGHMVKMAREMLAAGTILALIVPQKLSDFRVRTAEVKEEGKFLILGGGDVVFPLLLASSLARESLKSALIVAGFALLGLWGVFFLFSRQEKRRPLPALPPLAFFSILGYFIGRLIL